MNALPYLFVYTMPVSLLASITIGGWAYLLTPLLTFLMIPVMDQVMGQDDRNPSESEAAERTANPLFNLILRAWMPAHIGTIAVAAYVVSTGVLTGWELAGLTVATGLMGAAGINVAHELMHRKSKLDRALSESIMNAVSYTHFCIEHVHGHHRHVGTPRDPASSYLGQSVYNFYPKVVWGSLLSAIDIERTRNQRRKVPVLSVHNRLTRYLTVAILTHTTVLLTLGWQAELFFIVQGVAAFSLLEVINYVEHYGLHRTEVSPGKYGPVMEWHSWNANHQISNYWLFNLQRHADHHAHAHRPYYLLRAVTDGPQLPFSYPTMLLISLVPPLWRAVMDPRVLALRGEPRWDLRDVALSAK